MATAAWVKPAIVKEVRGLLPMWLAFAVALGAILTIRASGANALSLPMPVRNFMALLVPLCWLGPVAIGALSVGHEFSHRTLGIFLTQPARRSQLFLVKGAVTLALIVTWAVMLLPILRFHSPVESGVLAGWRAFVFPAVYAICVAPWLTMVCRSALAGVLLTTAIPALLILTGDGIGVALYGPEFPGADRIADVVLRVLSWGTVVVAVVGAFATWRTAMNLEAGEAVQREWRVPEWWGAWNATAMGAADAGLPRDRNRVWLLVLKELHVQQLPLVLAGVYVIAMAIWRGMGEPWNAWLPRAAPTALYSYTVAVIVGAVASASERQYGTIEWQMLLPVATRWQWAFKLAVALGLSAALTIGLPGIFEPFLNRIGPPSLFIVLTAWAFYISSLCRHRLLAAVLSLAAGIGAFAFLQSLAEILWALRRTFPVAFEHALHNAVTPGQAARILWALMHFQDLSPLILFGPACALAVGFSLANHTMAEGGFARIVKQAGWIAVALAIPAVLVFLLNVAMSLTY